MNIDLYRAVVLYEMSLVFAYETALVIQSSFRQPG